MAIHSIPITPEMAALHGHTIPHSFNISGPDLENLETLQSECVLIAKKVFDSLAKYHTSIERRSRCDKKDLLKLNWEDDLHRQLRNKLVGHVSIDQITQVSIYAERSPRTDKIRNQIKRIGEAVKGVSDFSKKKGISFSQLIDPKLELHKKSYINIDEKSLEIFYFPRI